MRKFFLYFGFSQIEQRGFIVFLSLILIILLVPLIVKKINRDELHSYKLVYFEKLPLEEKRDLQKNSKLSFQINRSSQENISYFTFDPNNLDEESWVRLGFSNKQIRVIKNYEAKGGRFYKKEDLAKIYSISKDDYERIEPYIEIADNKSTQAKHRDHSSLNNSLITYSKSLNESLIDINLADTSELKTLKGIGSVLSNRILKYRDLLGGFYAIEQLSEVYGLPRETLDEIKGRLASIDSKMLRKLNVNTLSVEELTKHPYINKKQAQTIVNYRVQHGDFDNSLKLSLIQSLDKEFLRKIDPYLEF